MIRCFLLILFISALFSCSSGFKDQKLSSDLSIDEGDNRESNPNPKSPVLVGEKPSTYAEYKQWRTKNDLSGQTYANFKEWEAAYKRWKKQQSEKLR